MAAVRLVTSQRLGEHAEQVQFWGNSVAYSVGHGPVWCHVGPVEPQRRCIQTIPIPFLFSFEDVSFGGLMGKAQALRARSLRAVAWSLQTTQGSDGRGDGGSDREGPAEEQGSSSTEGGACLLGRAFQAVHSIGPLTLSTSQ